MKKGRLRKEDGPVQFLNWIGLKIGFCIFRIDDIAVGIRVDGVGARFDARILSRLKLLNVLSVGIWNERV
ncbi:hypothetical protein [Allobaculum sp. Allo2]|uniref:hypothetical protein n=1 Tax=Allobaculum sp. Allo2 TaxID=2853432 RepID=UPI001F611669|nr:hypothetical protein [Allobaculum sp. Allo2]UNT93871.1 hypothetical protein KWG61_03915 [Allobaculum sp. Allo2]